ncbi:hypothetical protein BJ912DRAFT_1143693 [Pholiota molesta]|nr:hypothetical protein BJ912DRAFT_1143693 [Pholiota molesta]
MRAADAQAPVIGVCRSNSDTTASTCAHIHRAWHLVHVGRHQYGWPNIDEESWVLWDGRGSGAAGSKIHGRLEFLKSWIRLNRSWKNNDEDDDLYIDTKWILQSMKASLHPKFHSRMHPSPPASSGSHRLRHPDRHAGRLQLTNLLREHHTTQSLCELAALAGMQRTWSERRYTAAYPLPTLIKKGVYTFPGRLVFSRHILDSFDIDDDGKSAFSASIPERSPSRDLGLALFRRLEGIWVLLYALSTWPWMDERAVPMYILPV